VSIASPDAVVVVLPVYKPRPTPLERFSLQQSFARLDPRRRVVLIGPEAQDLGAYRELVPRFDWMPFPAPCFATIQGYSRLLLSPAFYRAFAPHEFMLILQDDALLLRDDLDFWAGRPFDYVGAPWPAGVELFVNLDRHAGAAGQRVRAASGNGGLSLRRNRACIELLAEFPQAYEYFQRSGSSEDLFFAVLGAVSTRFVLPNEMTAARFSLEIDPRRYHAIHRAPPMGGHAWWKHDPGYWLEQLGPSAGEAAALLADARILPARAA
jgi:hypothetical protein